MVAYNTALQLLRGYFLPRSRFLQSSYPKNKRKGTKKEQTDSLRGVSIFRYFGKIITATFTVRFSSDMKRCGRERKFRKITITGLISLLAFMVRI